MTDDDSAQNWLPTPKWVTISAGPLEGRVLLLVQEVWEEMLEGRYEPFVFDVLGGQEGLRAKTVWDVGAHVGYHTLAFARLVSPSGRVIAFEPNPHNADRIRMHLERNPRLADRVDLRPEALSNQEGETSFFLSPEVDSGLSSGSHISGALVPESEEIYEPFDRISVPATRVDTLLQEGQAPPPDVIKIDVEGAELSVLEGGLETLSSLKPTLLVEVHHVITMFHAQKLLTELGYEICVVDEEHYSASRCHIIAKPVIYSTLGGVFQNLAKQAREKAIQNQPTEQLQQQVASLQQSRYTRQERKLGRIYRRWFPRKPAR